MERMTSRINLSRKKRGALPALAVIRQLYPEETYPVYLFPDIQDILLDLFFKTVKSEAYRQAKGIDIDDSGDNRIKTAAREILDFKNLLKNHPQTVVLLYRHCIAKYIKRRHPVFHEQEDLVQEILTRLITHKMGRIQEKYDFKFKEMPSFKSYLMVTVRNIYIDIIRERKNRPLAADGYQSLDDIFDENRYDEMASRLVIEQELRLFRTLLDLYFRVRPKLELCMKLKFRISIEAEEVKQTFPVFGSQDVEALTGDYRFVSDKKMFGTINEIFNTYQVKKNKSDSLRKWVDVKIEEMVSHLNRIHRGNVYNTDKIADLIRLYYQAPADRETEGIRLL
jgi:DNA-directed RNA polymerase specialized sigma24 family protein